MTATSALSLDDVRALIEDGGRVFARDPAKILHLLNRMAVTLELAREQMRAVGSEIEQLKQHRERMGQPLSLNITEQLQFLSAEQIVQHRPDVLTLGADSQRVQAQMEAARIAFESSKNRLRLELGHVLGDATLSDETRMRIRAIVDSLGAGPQQEVSTNLDDLFGEPTP